MAGFIQNMIWNSVEGFVEAGKRTAGGYAGDALIKAGDLIENSGRSVGTGIERKATGYGTAITGQKYQPSAKALPSTARKPALTRSSSSPASTSVKRTAPTSKMPLGATKYPGGKQVTAGLSAAKSAIGGTVGRAQSTAGSTKGAATTGTTKSLTKPFPTNTPKPYSGASEKKTAVKPGRPKPFNPPTPKPEGEKKLYEGSGSKKPVKKYKPLPRMQGTAAYGQVKHISV